MPVEATKEFGKKERELLERLVGLTTTDPVEAAAQVHGVLMALAEPSRQEVYQVALLLHVMKRFKLWRFADPEVKSWEEYLETYGLTDWARRGSSSFLSQIKEFVEIAEREGLSPDELVEKLAKAGWVKAEVIKPAVKAGVVTLAEALAEAAALGRRDLEQKCRERLEGAQQSKSCLTCLYLRRADKRRGEKLLAVIRTEEGERERPESVEVDEEEAGWRYCPKTRRVWVRGPYREEAEKVGKECNWYVSAVL